MVVVGQSFGTFLGSPWLPDTFVLGLCEKRSLGRRSSRACWVRPHSGEPRHDSRPLVRPSQRTPRCLGRGRVLGRGARLRSTHGKVVFICEGVMDLEGLPLNISRVPAAGQGLPRVQAEPCDDVPRYLPGVAERSNDSKKFHCQLHWCSSLRPS